MTKLEEPGESFTDTSTGPPPARAAPWECVVNIPKKAKAKVDITASLYGYGSYGVGPTTALRLETAKP